MPGPIKTWMMFKAGRDAAIESDKKRALDPIRQASLKFYKSTQWQRLRRMQLADEPLCRTCGDIGVHIDHITPIRAGGSAYALDNLQTLCHACHSRKTRREAAEAGSTGIN